MSESVTSFNSDYEAQRLSTLDRSLNNFSERTFTSSVYHTTLLQGFSELRKYNQLCDVTLVAGKDTFQVHRVLLAACSPYFRNLFVGKDGAQNSAICKPIKDKDRTKSKKKEKLGKKKTSSLTNGNDATYQNVSELTEASVTESKETRPPSPTFSIRSKFSLRGKKKDKHKDKDNSEENKEPIPSIQERPDSNEENESDQEEDNATIYEAKDTPVRYTWYSETIELRGISSEGLKYIVEFLYTGKIPISMTSVQNILVVARHMEITPVLDFCTEFLTTAIDVFTCVDIIHIAEVFGMPKLETAGFDFILNRFPDFMKSPQLQKLTFDNIIQVLDSDDLKALTEMDVFAATLKWVMYEPDRQAHIRKLMEKIRFPLMPPRDLMVHVNVVDFMRSKCNDLLLEASSYHMLPHSQPIVPSKRCSVRSNEKRLIVVGGADNTDEVSNQLKVFNHTLTAYTLLPNMDKGIHSHCICVLNNFLYVIGGQQTFEDRGKTATEEVNRYDPRFNTWMKIAAMNEKRAGFSVSVIPSFNRIYAVGGVNSVGRLSSVECYCVEEDRWKYVASTQNAICDHASSVYKDQMFVCGGFSEGKFSENMLCYNPKHDIWERRSAMQTPRGWHQMVTYWIGVGYFRSTIEQCY